MSTWLTAAEAAARLGVKRATVYAYVSRGELERRREGRTSYVRASDVERLVRLGRRPSLNEFGKTSRLSTLSSGVLHYRGTPVPDLVARPFESVATFLWTGQTDQDAAWTADPYARDLARRLAGQLPGTATPADRLRVAVAGIAAAGQRGDSAEPVEHQAGTLIRTLVESLPPRSEVVEPGPQGSTMAGLLWSRLTSLEPGDDHLALLNAALVLLADHGLAASTYAAQIAASASADLHRVLAAGLAVGSSALLGASALGVESMLSVADVRGIVVAATEHHRRSGELPGFGHPLHRGGDLRAAHLLGLLKPFAATNPRLRRSLAALDVLRRSGAPAPNVYLALGMISTSFEMDPGASEAIFGVARSAGWIAHALEERRTGTIQQLRSSQRLLDRW